jgi:twinkle protein
MANADRGAAFLEKEIAGKPRLVSPSSLIPKIMELWRNGLAPGDKTGWPSLDQRYSVAPGMLTIVTGWPGAGKSEWLDAMLVHLARQGWRTAMFSPENRPYELHAAKFMEKVSGKPFGRGPNERISEDEAPEFAHDLARYLMFIDAPDGSSLSVRKVIEAAEPWLGTEGKRALVMDPWNELEHWRPAGLSETEYVSQTLSYVRNWARTHGVHVFIVAHPRNEKRIDGKLPIAKLDMISGSQHWWNKADFGISIWRDLENHENPEVEVHILKVRFKHMGKVGLVPLRYDRVTGRYHDIPNLRDVNAYRRATGDDE